MVEKNLSVLESPVSVRLHRALCKVRDHAGMFSVLYTIPSPSQGLAADYLHTSWQWVGASKGRKAIHMDIEKQMLDKQMFTGIGRESTKQTLIVKPC